MSDNSGDHTPVNSGDAGGLPREQPDDGSKKKAEKAHPRRKKEGGARVVVKATTLTGGNEISHPLALISVEVKRMTRLLGMKRRFLILV